MSEITKSFRFRVYQTDDSTVDWTETVNIAGVGEVGGQRISPLTSGASSRPWSVEIADVAEVITARLADSSGRAQLLRRLADLSVSTDGGSTYTVLATGRIDSVEMVDVAAFRFTVTDERLIERTTTIFRGTNTTRLAPAGLNAAWLDYQPRNPARYAVQSIDGVNNTTTYDLLGPDVDDYGEFLGDPALIVSAALDLMEEDVVANPAGNQGNFTHLRVNVDGTDREVVKFNGSIASNPLKKLGDESGEATRVHRFTVADYQDPGGVDQLREIYFHMPTRDPTPKLPLHIGGQDGVDAFTLVKDIYDGTYQDATNPQTVRYESAAFTAYNASTNPNGLIDNPRFPKIHPRVFGPETMAVFLEREVYGPLGVTPFVNSDGEVAPRVSRQPATDQVADPDTLFEFTKANLSGPHPTWHNVGREQVTVVETTFAYTRARTRREELEGEDGPLDGLMTAETTVTNEHDNVGTAGRMVHRLSVGTIHRPGDRAAFARQVSSELFERFGDGPIKTSGAGLSGSESVVVGQWVIQDLDTYPALQNQSRSGKRLMQVMARVDTPEGPNFELLEAGPNSQPLGAATVALAANSNDDHNAVDVTISSLPAAADGYEVHLAVNATEPAEESPLWQYRTLRGTANETVTARRIPSGETIWARVRSTGVGRISSDWSAAVSQATTALTAPSALADTLVTGNTAEVGWTNGETDFDIVLDLGGTDRVRLPAETDTYKFRRLLLSTGYTWGAKHVDGYGGESPRSTDTFTTTGTPEAVPRPEGIRILVGD